MCHTALDHYSGGWPVPRDLSYTSGGLHVYAIIPVNVGVFLPHFAFFLLFKQPNSKGFAIRILSGSG